MLKDALLRDVVVLVLANKQDLPKAASPSAMTDELRLRDFRQKWKVQGTSTQAFCVVPRVPYPDSPDCNCRFVPHCQVAVARREMGCTQAWTGSQTTCPQRPQEERVLRRSSLLACGCASVFPPFSRSVVASRSILLVLNSVKVSTMRGRKYNWKFRFNIFYFNWKTFSTLFTLFNLHQSLLFFKLFLKHAHCRLNPHKSIYVGSTCITRMFDCCWPWFVIGSASILQWEILSIPFYFMYCTRVQSYFIVSGSRWSRIPILNLKQSDIILQYRIGLYKLNIKSG